MKDFQCLVYKHYDFEDAKICAFRFFGSPSSINSLSCNVEIVDVNLAFFFYFDQQLCLFIMDAGLSEKMKKFDFVRFTFADTNGIPRCKIVPVNHIPAVMISGNIGFCSFIVISDASSNPVYYEKLMKAGDPDFLAVPQMETLHSYHGSAESKYRVGQIICHLIPNPSSNSQFGVYDSRYICVRLVRELETAFGFRIWSALEYEFVLISKERVPVFDGKHMFSSLVAKQMEPFLFMVSGRLQQTGINVETMHSEFGSGQFEITTSPNFGEKAADTAFLFKQCVKESAIDMNYEASFMSNPWDDVRNGGHYNFSLWKDDCNIFSSNESPYGLSEDAKFWIAGLFAHIDSIVALVCPTNNCFNGFVKGVQWGVAPSNVSYDFENRDCCIRVKKSASSGSFMEFRTPSSAANPYLVVAAVVAAGLDGLRRKLKVGYHTELLSLYRKTIRQ